MSIIPWFQISPWGFEKKLHFLHKIRRLLITVQRWDFQHFTHFFRQTMIILPTEDFLFFSYTVTNPIWLHDYFDLDYIWPRKMKCANVTKLQNDRKFKNIHLFLQFLKDFWLFWKSFRFFSRFTFLF